ncbi:hypothetical protein GCM10029963_50080 [Micromonospora andamanensis]
MAVPDTETDMLGLQDASGRLRVLGAASVAPGVIAETSSPSEVRALLTAQASALPDDSRGIAPSIRFHAQRIAEANRPAPPAAPGDGPTAPGTPPGPDASDVVVSRGPSQAQWTSSQGSGPYRSRRRCPRAGISTAIGRPSMSWPMPYGRTSTRLRSNWT